MACLRMPSLYLVLLLVALPAGLLWLRGGLPAPAQAAPAAAPPSGSQAPAPPCGNYTWTQVASPSPSDQNYLYGVSALSATDAWAVGLTWSGFGSYQTLAEHWNGATWTVVPSPNPDYDPVLRGVDARAANDVWAVGDANYTPIIEH